MIVVVWCVGLLSGVFPAEIWRENARIEPKGLVPPELLADDAQGLVVLMILLHPYSTGHIQLRSANFREKPVIHANYFSDERDVETLAAGGVEAVKVACAMGYDEKDILVHPDLAHLPKTSREVWRTHVRRLASTIYHPSSTCAMGKVVDSDLKVKGARRLRVADASVFPHLTSGNTNAPAIMVGEMAADIIKKEYRLLQ